MSSAAPPPESSLSYLMGLLNGKSRVLSARQAKPTRGPTVTERQALSALAFWCAQDRDGSEEIAGVTARTIDEKTAVICPLTFQHSDCGGAEDFYLLPEADDGCEPLTLWAQKVAGLPFERTKQLAAKQGIKNVQPLAIVLNRMIQADEAAILPSLDILKRFAWLLEAHLAFKLPWDKKWELDEYFLRDESMACTTVDCGSRLMYAHSFSLVSLKKRSGGMQPSLTRHMGTSSSQVHYFRELERGQLYPASVEAQLPHFPSLLPIATAVAVFIYKAEVKRGIKEWQESFAYHYNVARYVADLLSVRTVQEFQLVYWQRPEGLDNPVNDVGSLMKRSGLEPENMERRRVFPTREREMRWAREDEEQTAKHAGRSPPRKRKRLIDEKDDETLMQELQSSFLTSDSSAESFDSPTAGHLARELYKRASEKLAIALEEVFDDGRIAPYHLLGGWRKIYTVFGEEEAVTFDRLRSAKREARFILRRAEGKPDDEKVWEEAGDREQR